MKLSTRLGILLSALAFTVVSSAEAEVVTSIKPLAFIAADLTQGVTTASTLIDGNQSPHTAQITPDKVKKLTEAELFVYIDDNMEISISKLVGNPRLRPEHVLKVSDIPGIKNALVKGIHFDHDEEDQPAQTSKDDAQWTDGDGTKVPDEVKAAFAKADHDDDDDHDHDHDDHDHDHDGHDGHDHDGHDHDDHDHDHDHGAADHDHDDDHDHDHDGHHHHGGLETNYHLWNSPVFAKEIAKAMAKELETLYPAKKEQIQANLTKFNENLDATVKKIKDELVPANVQNYMVYHDAYTYFEQDFGIRDKMKGALYFNVSIDPSAKTLKDLNDAAKANNVKVIFTEPQFNSAIAKKLADFVGAKVGVLDPLGYKLPIEAGSYDQYLLDLANSYKTALK